MSDETPESTFESPTWHGEELTATEQRLAQGQEKVVDWEDAKKELYQRLNEGSGPYFRDQ